MDFIQIQTESLPLCALATLWKWAKSVESKNIIYFVCFHRQSLRSVTFGVTYNYYECPWIPSKFDVKHSHCTLIHPCEYEQNLMNQKFHLCT